MRYFYYIDEGLSGIFDTETEDLEEVVREAVNHFCKIRKHTVTLYGRPEIGEYKVVVDKVTMSVEKKG